MTQTAMAKPIVEYAPALIPRKRSAKGLTETLKRIKEQIENGEAIPGEFGDLAEIRPKDGREPSDEPEESNAVFDGEVFSPKPSNDEQRRIVDKPGSALDPLAGIAYCYPRLVVIAKDEGSDDKLAHTRRSGGIPENGPFDALQTGPGRTSPRSQSRPLMALRRRRTGRLDEAGAFGFTGKWDTRPGKQVMSWTRR